MKIIYENLGFDSANAKLSTPGEDIVCVGGVFEDASLPSFIFMRFISESLMDNLGKVLPAVFAHLDQNWEGELTSKERLSYLQSGSLVYQLSSDQERTLLPVQYPGEANASVQAFIKVHPRVSVALLNNANAAQGIFEPVESLVTQAS